MKFKKTLRKSTRRVFWVFAVLLVISGLFSLYLPIIQVGATPNPSTVGTSEEIHADAISQSFQRKGFGAAGRFWVPYSNGTDMVYKTSTDGITWSALIVIKHIEGTDIASYQFSFWFDGAYLHYALAPTVSGHFYYRRGIPNADGTITWSAAEQDITTLQTASYPFVSVDSNGYPWIAYIRGNDIEWHSTISKSSTNNGTWSTASGFPYEFSLDASSSTKMSIIPLTGGRMLAIQGTEAYQIKVKSWNGTAWGSPVVTTSTIAMGYAYSAVAEGDDVDLVFSKATTYDIVFTKYSYTSNAFGSETTVQAGAAFASPVLGRNSTTNYLYCFWLDFLTANHIYYKKNVGGTWDSSPTDWITEVELTDSSRLTCFYQSYDSKLGLVWMNSTGAPYQVRFDYLITEAPSNTAPTISTFQAPSTVYANKYFLLNATINDADGVADFVNATIEISNSVVLKWVNTTTETYHFSEYSDPNNYCTLDASGSLKTNLNTTSHKLSWKIKLTWTYPEGSVNVVVTNTKVFDSAGASGSGSQTALFTFEDDLIVNSASVNDARVNPSQSLTFTGQLYYQGTSTAPEDVTGITAKISLSGAVKGSSTTINSTGYFQITFNAETSFQLHAYTVYAVTDQNTVQNQTVNVVVDRLNVTSGGVSDTHCDYGSTQTVWFKVYYQYGSVALTSSYGTVYVNGSAMTWSVANGRWEKTYGYSASVKYAFQVSSITETQYGLTTVNDAVGAKEIIWDRVVVSINANSTNPNAGQTIQSTITATYEYNGATVTSWTVNIKRNGTHFATGNFTDSSPSEVTYQYTTENVTENTYGLTVFTTNTLTVTWANLFVEINQITVADSRINIGTQAKAYYHCRWSSNQTSCTTGTLYVNSTGFSINGTGWATVTFTFSTVTKKVLAVTGVNVTGETDYGQVPANPEITWDRVEIYYFAVDDSNVNVNDNVEVRVKARLDYDDHAFGSGDSISVNGTALSWDATNNWFDGLFSKSSAGNWTFQVSSGIEATYNITSVYHAVSLPHAVWNSLEVHSLSLTYLGNSQYQYKAAVRYGYQGTAINGATLKLLHPNLITETSFTSNSTGWITFILAQSNITQAGTWKIYGFNDNNYGITYKAQNQTFNIWNLALTAKNWNLNATLSDATFKIYYGATLVTQLSSAYMPQNTYELQVYWLKNLLINETASYSLTASASLNLKCKAYPYTISGTQYHWASNATWISQSWNSTSLKLEIHFSATANTYTLVADGPRPTYLLNVTFNMPVDYTTYLSLAHYGNTTITLSYEAWGDFYIRSTQHRLTSVYWTSQKLTILIEGTTGKNGTLTVYCGSRGGPRQATGLANPTYNADTKILSGTYTFSSTVTVTLDWASVTGGTTGGTSTFGKLDLTIEDIRLTLAKGATETFNLTIHWTGVNDITITEVTITEEYVTWFSLAETLPKQASKGTEAEGTVTIQMKISVPWQITLGQHTIPVTVTASQEGGVTIEKSGVIYLTVTSTAAAATGGIPEVMTFAFLISILAISIYGFAKKKR